MKFLTFSDLHEDKKALKDLVDRAKEEDIDFVVCAGDVSTFGRGLRDVLKKFNDLQKIFYLIPGNHESEEMINKLIPDYPQCVNVNRKAVKVEGYIFLGYGEGGFAVDDPNFRKIAREWYGKHKDKKTVLIVHQPPLGTTIDILDEKHVGNRDFRKFIERIRPRLVICGHLHETVGIVDKIGKTKIVNPGWEGMVIELK